MWEPLLSGVEVNEKLEEIAQSVTANKDKLKAGGLLNGLAGLSVFYAHYARYTGSEEYRQLAEQTLSEALDLVTTEWHPQTFCSGFPGLLWTADYLKNNDLISTDLDTSSADEYAESIMLKMIADGNNDFLHGSLGVFYYLVSKENPNEKVIGEYLKILLEKRIRYDDGSSIWDSVIINGESRVVGKNFSLSHGVASLMVILSKLYQKQGDPKIAEIVVSLRKFIEKYKKEDAANLALYPSYVVDDGRPLNYNSRLGWCYGDLCVALAYLNSGICLNDQEFIKASYEIFRHAALRTDLEANHVNDAGICHGAAGLAHIFNRAYNYFKDEDFKKTALYWYKETLNLGNHPESETAGYLNHTVDGWTSEVSFLVGISGIGTALISASSDDEPNWDSILLIS